MKHGETIEDSVLAVFKEHEGVGMTIEAVAQLVYQRRRRLAPTGPISETVRALAGRGAIVALADDRYAVPATLNDGD